MIQLTLDKFLPDSLYAKVGRLFMLRREQRRKLPLEYSLSTTFHIDKSKPVCSLMQPEAQEIIQEYTEFILPTVEKFIDRPVMAENWFKDFETAPWHIDKDELLFRTTGEIKPTKLSTIFYHECNLPPQEGRLRLIDAPWEKTKNWKRANENEMWTDRADYQMHIRPVPNRLVIFSPMIYHIVESFNTMNENSERRSLLLNFWDHELCT